MAVEKKGEMEKEIEKKRKSEEEEEGRRGR